MDVPVTMITLSERSGMSSVDHLALGGQFALYMDIMIPIVDEDVAVRCVVVTVSRSQRCCLLIVGGEERGLVGYVDAGEPCLWWMEGLCL
jgi:hypothetical protein